MFGFLKKKNSALEQEVQAQEELAIQQEEEFDLDEIMKEFSESDEPMEELTEDVAEETVEESVEEPLEEAVSDPEEVTSETIRVEVPAELLEEHTEPELGDTQRIEVPEDIVKASCESLGDTQRIEVPEDIKAPAAPMEGDTIKFDAIGDEADIPPVPAEPVKEEAEPFSEGWEPEYEQPIGEYIPPQPIIFQPKSRLRELKRKLVAGPERRYYELSEQGVFRLQIAILVSLLVAVLSTGATVAYEMGMMAERLKLVAFGQLFGMLIAALMGIYQLMDGVADIFKKKFSLNSLLVFSLLACVADGVFCLREQRVPCCAAFTVQMAMSLWSTYHHRSTELGQMDTMRKATRLDSVVAVEDYHDGCTGFLRGEGQVEDFMDHYQEPSNLDKFVSLYAMIACVASVAIGAMAGVLQGSVSFGVQVLAAALLVAVPGTFFITLSRPMAVLEQRMHKLGTVLCGWNSINKLSQRAVFPVEHKDLFPGGSCKLNGVKFYGSRDPDQVVAYSTAVVAADGGGLTPLFEYLLQSRNGQRYSVENLRLYGGGGIGGEVCGEPVLVGTQEFLKDMGVEIPEGTMVSQAMYVAVDGELCGVFAVSCAKTKGAASGLATLCSYRGLRPVLVTHDFMLTEEFIHDKFGVNTRKMVFPEHGVRKDLASVQPEADAPALALSTRDGLASFAFAVTGARSVRTASLIGMVIHLVGGILGMGIITVLAVLSARGLMTPVNMLLYQLVWMIPGLMVTEWTRAL